MSPFNTKEIPDLSGRSRTALGSEAAPMSQRGESQQQMANPWKRDCLRGRKSTYVIIQKKGLAGRMQEEKVKQNL